MSRMYECCVGIEIHEALRPRSVRGVRNTYKITFRWSTAVFLGTMVGQIIWMRSRKLQESGISEDPRSIYQHLYQKAAVGVRKFSTQ